MLTRYLSVADALHKNAMEQVLGHLILAKFREEKNNVLYKVLFSDVITTISFKISPC